MSDISSRWNADTLRADWIVGNGDLLSGDDLQSAIMISLFTDRLAHSDDDYDDEYRRGGGPIPERMGLSVPVSGC